jgi:hypothetical protein
MGGFSAAVVVEISIEKPSRTHTSEETRLLSSNVIYRLFSFKTHIAARDF